MFHGGTLGELRKFQTDLFMSPGLGRSKNKGNVEGFYILLILQEQQQKNPKIPTEIPCWWLPQGRKTEGKRKDLIILSNKWKIRQIKCKWETHTMSKRGPNTFQLAHFCLQEKLSPCEWDSQARTEISPIQLDGGCRYKAPTPEVGPNPEKVQGQVREILTNGLQDIIE